MEKYKKMLILEKNCFRRMLEKNILAKNLLKKILPLRLDIQVKNVEPWSICKLMIMVLDYILKLAM